MCQMRSCSELLLFRGVLDCLASPLKHRGAPYSVDILWVWLKRSYHVGNPEPYCARWLGKHSREMTESLTRSI